MTTFAPTADSRYIHAIRGGAYARSIESKTRKVCGFSHQSQKAVVGGQPTSNLSNVFGVSLSASVVLLASKITNLLMQRNNQTAQMAPTCVKLVVIQKNKGSDFSLAKSQKWVYNMLVTNFINEKRESDVFSIISRTSHNDHKEVVMSLRHVLYHAMPRQCHEESLKNWGLS